ncbi:MAG: hydroxymethylbilane synthase [Planctomycetota bacterium]
MPTIHLATRKSKLALAQTRMIEKALVALHPGLSIKLVTVVTAGDRDRRNPLSGMNETGVFTKALEAKLLAKDADIAVHSLKDLPVELPEGLVIAAILPREDPRDALVSRKFTTLGDLPPGSRVGTSSPRRRAQILHIRPDLAVRDIRGNVDTRLAKITSGEFDAAILAVAGMKRLEIKGWPIVPLDGFLPAPGQGALAIETRAGDKKTRDLIAPLHDAPTALAVEAERRLLAALGGGCHMPLGALGEVRGDTLRLHAVFFSADGKHRREGAAQGPIENVERIVEEVRRMIAPRHV